jgi:hypothetical protein
METIKYWDKSIEIGTSITSYAGSKEHSIPFKVGSSSGLKRNELL